MENLFTIKSLYTFYAEYQLLIILFIMVIFLYPFLISAKTVVLPGISKLIGYKNKNTLKFFTKKTTWTYYKSIFSIISGILERYP